MNGRPGRIAGIGRAALLLAVVAASLFAGTAGAQSLVSRYVAGQHYQVLDTPVANPDDGRIHVIEFFLYSCPHCFDLEPALEKWRAGLGDDVVFSRVPVLFGGGARMHSRHYARLYYAARKLGVLDKVHADIFDAIHVQGQPLLTRKALDAFMSAHGVDVEQFNAAFDSGAVKAKVQAVGKTMRAYRVLATPSLGVAGRYYVSGRTAGSNERMFDVADYLIEQQREKDGGE